MELFVCEISSEYNVTDHIIVKSFELIRNLQCMNTLVSPKPIGTGYKLYATLKTCW